MKEEYDFTDAEQGMFFRPAEALDIPIYLDREVRDFFMKKIKEHDRSLNELVNELLKKDIEISKKIAS